MVCIYANLVTSHLACTMHVNVHGTCAPCRTSTSKYSSGLACMQVDPNLAKITTSHSWVLNTQNTNQNMPHMLAIAYLNENVEKSVFTIGLISSSVDQFNSWCSPMQRLLVYMYLSQLMSTFTNYLKGASFPRWFLHSLTQKNQ